jgi:hypothetical protein
MAALCGFHEILSPKPVHYAEHHGYARLLADPQHRHDFGHHELEAALE